MSARFFLDTNIFVYTFDSSAPLKAKRSGQLIRRAVDSGEGVTSFQVVQEFLNVALSRFARPMTVAEAEQYLVTVLRPLVAVHSSPALYLLALRIVENQGLSWYDSLIVAAALEARCDVLFSEHLQHGFRIQDLRVENPFRT